MLTRKEQRLIERPTRTAYWIIWAISAGVMIALFLIALAIDIANHS